MSLLSLTPKENAEIITYYFYEIIANIIGKRNKMYRKQKKQFTKQTLCDMIDSHGGEYDD